jgi:hypothetical protein
MSQPILLHAAPGQNPADELAFVDAMVDNPTTSPGERVGYALLRPAIEARVAASGADPTEPFALDSLAATPRALTALSEREAPIIAGIKSSDEAKRVPAVVPLRLAARQPERAKLVEPLIAEYNKSHDVFLGRNRPTMYEVRDYEVQFLTQLSGIITHFTPETAVAWIEDAASNRKLHDVLRSSLERLGAAPPRIWSEAVTRGSDNPITRSQTLLWSLPLGEREIARVRWARAQRVADDSRRQFAGQLSRFVDTGRVG